MTIVANLKLTISFSFVCQRFWKIMKLLGVWQWSPTCSVTLSNWLTTLIRKKSDFRPQITASPLDISPTCSLVARRLLLICRVRLYHCFLKILTGSEMIFKAWYVILLLLHLIAFFNFCAGWVTANGKGLTYLTDPQIHSTITPEGPSNFADRGLKLFVEEQHGPRCNDICHLLRLPQLSKETHVEPQ